MLKNVCSSISATGKNIAENISLQTKWLQRVVIYMCKTTLNITIHAGNSLRNQCIPLLKWSILNQHETLAKLFICIVADVDVHPKNELSLLQHACARKQVTVVQHLISKGANPNRTCTHSNYTPLFWTVNKSDTNTLKILLDNGADINKKSRRHSPLIYALNEGKKEIAEFLLDQKADPNQGTESISEDSKTTNKRTESGLYIYSCFSHYALPFEKRKEYVDLLLANNADPNKGYETIEENYTTSTPLYEQIYHHTPDTNKTFLGKKITRETPLYRFIDTIQKNATVDYSLLELLLNKGADPNKGKTYIDESNPKNNKHTTPLSIAASNNHLDCVKLLLSKGALPNYQAFPTDDVHYPLYMAVKNKNIEMVKLLLESGADAKTKGQKLLWASEENIEISNLLKKYGADDNGESPPHIWFWNNY